MSLLTKLYNIFRLVNKKIGFTNQKIGDLNALLMSEFSDIRALITELRNSTDENAETQFDHATLLTAGLSARAERLRFEKDLDLFDSPIQRDIPFESALEEIEQMNPRLFPLWIELFRNGEKAYIKDQLGSCSHREHYYAKLFGAYIEIYGHGQILDIGCGPNFMPSYLSSRMPQLLSGLEPLPYIGNSEDRVLQGFNELLPWEDNQFDTVVSGTSLDHVLSLELSLKEVIRVLKPNGKYLVWLASIPGASSFDEKADEFEAIDEFHLFHFDKVWIEPIFEDIFEITDVTTISQPGFDHVFYCLTPRYGID